VDAALGGGILTVGVIWLCVEAMFRYSANRRVGIVLWRGRWPTDRAGRDAIRQNWFGSRGTLVGIQH